MFNKAQLSKDRKDAKKPRTLAKPRDIDYVSKMGYRDDSPFNGRPYIDIKTPNGSIDMSNTGIDLIANGRFLPKYSGLHQFDTTEVRETPVAEDGGQYVDLTDEEIAEYRRGGYVVEELPKAQTAGTTGLTSQDYMDVYNNSLEIQNYINNQAGYFRNSGEEAFNKMYSTPEQKWARLSQEAARVQSGERVPTSIFINGQLVPDYQFKPSDYYQQIDDNKFKQREVANGILNYDIPMALFDKRIPIDHFLKYESDAGHAIKWDSFTSPTYNLEKLKEVMANQYPEVVYDDQGRAYITGSEIQNPPSKIQAAPATSPSSTQEFYMLNPHTGEVVYDWDPVAKKNVARVAPAGSISNVPYSQGAAMASDTPEARAKEERQKADRAMSDMIKKNPDENAKWLEYKKQNPQAVFIEYRDKVVPTLQQPATTPEQLATDQQLNVRKKGGKTLTKAQNAGTTGNNNGCPEGHWWDPTTGTCVPMPAVQYIEDENDPRYKKYLDQMNLYKYSTLDNYYKQSNYLDPDEILAGQFEDPDWKWTDYVADMSDAQRSYQDENKGYYDSQNILKTIPASELKNYFSGLNISDYGANRSWNLDQDYGQLLASNDLSKWQRKDYEVLKRLKEEYPPQYYRTNVGYTNHPINQYYDTNPNATYGSSNYWIKPDTQVIEDDVNRDELKKIYPSLTNEQIDQWVSNIKANPDYITNKTFLEDGNKYYHSLSDEDDPKINASGNFPITGISGIGTTNVPAGTKAFLPDDIQNDIKQSGSYIPIWGPPSERFELKAKEPELPAEPENVWIRQKIHPEKNIFGKPKKGQEEHWEEKQVAAGSDEANRYFASSQHSPDSIKYFHDYPMYDAAGRPVFTNFIHSPNTEIPKYRQFTTEGAYPYGHAPAATTPEQLATEQEIDVRRQGGYVSKQMVHFLTGGAYEEGGSASKPANRWAVTDPRSLQVDDYFPKLAEGGSSSQLYIHPDRMDAVYKKDSKGKWLIKSDDTSGKFVPLKDPDGKRAANLNKNAVPAKKAGTNPAADKHVVGATPYTYVNSRDVPDRPGEDIGEIFDPTGLSSWDDISRSYSKEGMSPNTALEIFGAIPLLGKLKWAGEAVQDLGKTFAVTGRQKRNAKVFGNTMKGIAKYGPGIGRATDAYQAYANHFANNNLGPKYQDGGNTDPGNNALELHMFYDKDVYKMQKGGTKPVLGEEVYTYADRPEAQYKKDQSGAWHIMLPSTNNQYVPINDPSGQRSGELEEKAKVYVDPKKFARTYDPMMDMKPVPSETTQQVAGNLAQQVQASNPMSLNKFIENGVVLPNAPKISSDTPLWYPTDDIYYSPEEIYIQSTEYNRRMEECKKGDAQCFEQAQRYYDNYVAPKLNVPNYNEIKTNMGITSGDTHPNYDKYGKSADSWDIAALMAENEGKVFYKGDPNNPMSFQTQWGLGMGDPTYTEDQQNKYNDYWKSLNLPLGTIVNAGDAGGTGHYGTSSYNKEKGFVPSNHSSIVIGYSADGVPYLYDYGDIVSAADPGSLINRMGVTNIVAPKDVLNNTFGNIGTGEKITSDANTKLRFDTSKIQADPDEFKPFMNVLSSEKDMIRKALGVSDAEYNELARQSMATALAETGGGDDATIRWINGIPIPSYLKDKSGINLDLLHSASTGISQINPDVLFSGKDPQLARMLEAMGLDKESYDPWDPRDAAMATMAMVQANKKVAEANFKKAPTNDPNMSPAMMQYYQWNTPGTLREGEAWGENANIQRFMDIYNSLTPVDAEGNKMFKQGGSYEVTHLTDKEIKELRKQGFRVDVE